MAWYNKDITKETVKKFYLHNDNRLASITDCYQEEIRGATPIRIIKEESHQKRMKKMEERFDYAWNFFEQLVDQCAKNGMALTIKDSHLKFHNNKTGTPNYTACLYVSYIHNNNDYKILNLGVLTNDTSVEIRYPISEIFSIEQFMEENPKIKIGWINDLPYVGFNQLSEINYNNVINYLYKYVCAIREYLDANYKLNPAGESKAEVILYRDLEHLYEHQATNPHWLRHGNRPIRNPNGGLLELDVQMDIPRNGRSIQIAIEIQGPHHYKAMYQNNPERWDAVDLKHQIKKEWCALNNKIFVWLDWQFFHNNFIKDGSRLRRIESRRDKVIEMIEKIITCYENGERYIEIGVV